jgi:hypothetical protein
MPCDGLFQAEERRFYALSKTEYQAQQPLETIHSHYQFIYIACLGHGSHATGPGLVGPAPRLSYDVVNLVARVAHDFDFRPSVTFSYS